MLEIIQGDILTTDCQYICHQTNCTSNGSAAGLAKVIFNVYPEADIYKNRVNQDDPGKIIIIGKVINMNAQIYPSKPKYHDSPKDGFRVRERYFKSCLDQIAEIPDLESVAFPWFIGCGLAGGQWETYFEMLTNFESSLNTIKNVRVKLYKKE